MSVTPLIISQPYRNSGVNGVLPDFIKRLINTGFQRGFLRHERLLSSGSVHKRVRPWQERGTEVAVLFGDQPSHDDNFLTGGESAQDFWFSVLYCYGSGF